MLYENEYEGKLITPENMEALKKAGKPVRMFEPSHETHPNVLTIGRGSYIVTDIGDNGDIQLGYAMRVTWPEDSCAIGYAPREDEEGLYLTFEELGALHTEGEEFAMLGWTKDMETALDVLGTVYIARRDDENKRVYLTPYDGKILVYDFEVIKAGFENPGEEELTRLAQEAVKERLDAGNLEPDFPLYWEERNPNKVKYIPKRN